MGVIPYFPHDFHLDKKKNTRLSFRAFELLDTLGAALVQYHETTPIDPSFATVRSILLSNPTALNCNWCVETEIRSRKNQKKLKENRGAMQRNLLSIVSKNTELSSCHVGTIFHRSGMKRTFPLTVLKFIRYSSDK